MLISCLLTKSNFSIYKQPVRVTSLQNDELLEKTESISSPQIKKLTSDQIIMDNLTIIDTQIQFNEQTSFSVDIDSESILLTFTFQGETSEHNQVFAQQTEYDRNIIRYAPSFKKNFSMMANRLINYFVVVIPKDNYFKLINHNKQLHEQFSEKIMKGKPATLSDTYMPVLDQMKAVITEIRNCKKKGVMKKLFIQNRVSELLMLQLEQYQSQTSVAQQGKSLKNADEEKIHLAKEIIDNNYINNIPLLHLSLKTGLSLHKLKMVFKQCFGITIHAYITQLRLQKAYEILQQSQMDVMETATFLGYKHESLFSSAFAQHFGFFPSQVNKK